MMIKELAKQEQGSIRCITTAVFKLFPIENETIRRHLQTDPRYIRPWKTILARTVADGGKAFTFAAVGTNPALVNKIFCRL